MTNRSDSGIVTQKEQNVRDHQVHNLATVVLQEGRGWLIVGGLYVAKEGDFSPAHKRWTPDLLSLAAVGVNAVAPVRAGPLARPPAIFAVNDIWLFGAGDPCYEPTITSFTWTPEAMRQARVSILNYPLIFH